MLGFVDTGCIGGGWSVFISESTSDVASGTIVEGCVKLGGVLRLEEMIDSSLVCSDRSEER